MNGWKLQVNGELGLPNGPTLQPHACIPYLEDQVVNVYLLLRFQDLDEKATDEVPLPLQRTAFIFVYIQVHLFGQQPKPLTRHL